jgi:uncharacterized protein (TIGR03067 family)
MMKAVLSGFIASAVLFVVSQADEATLKKEKARFKGTWKIVRVENSTGEDDKYKGAMVVFDEAGTLELRHNDETKKADFKINPAAKLKEIDITPADGGRTMKGIYELKKDTLRICLDNDPDESQRPTALTPKAGTRQALFTLERAKK